MVFYAKRGNELTERSVKIYTLEELRSCRIEQMIMGIQEFARIVQAFHAKAPADEDSDEESTAQLAGTVLGKIEVLHEEVARKESANSHLVAILALDIGTLSERLHWMWLHEDATRKGYRRSSNEALAQRRGAAANKAKAQKKTKDIANWLKQEFSLEQLAILSDSALTRHLESSNSRAWRGIRGHISRARKTGLLPARQEM